MLDVTPFIRAYALLRQRSLQRNTPKEVQQSVLSALLRKAQNTRFGREHQFSKIRTVEDFQRSVPLRTYEQFWNEYWSSDFPALTNVTWPGTLRYFAVSSGTSSGTTKYIPYTDEMSRSNAKAGLDLLAFHVMNNPRSQILGGKNFMLGGSTELKQEAVGIWSGDLSGISVKEMPWWIKPWYFPPEELALIKDWEEKIAILAKASLASDIRLLGGVPSWLLIFIDHLSHLTGKPRKLSELYPNLEMLVHGGVNFAPYKEQFDQILEGSSAELREVYPASEGFIAMADRGYGEGLLLGVDRGIFYEFIPREELSNAQPTRHWVGNIEPGVDYAIALTTCAGLFSYVIGDTVRFVEVNPPRLLITGRTAYYLSAFGEHVIGEELEDAVAHAAESLALTVNDFSVGAVVPSNQGELGRHLYFVEFSHQIPSAEQISEFSARVDQRLSERNEDYLAHRAEGFGLALPEIRALPPGFFSDWMKSRGKLGGQNKVPRIISREELFRNLQEFAATY